jgi:hypothetical protein
MNKAAARIVRGGAPVAVPAYGARTTHHRKNGYRQWRCFLAARARAAYLHGRQVRKRQVDRIVQPRHARYLCGRGVAVIDPHGDLAEAIIDALLGRCWPRVEPTGRLNSQQREKELGNGMMRLRPRVQELQG